jgi:hypothetical protein
LVGGQQIALDPIGKKLQAALTFLTGTHTLLLQGQALGNPRWQGGSLNGLDLHADAMRIQGGEPTGRFGGFI